MLRFLGVAAGSTILLLAFVLGSDAKPAHKRALGDHYGPFLTQKLNDCRTCHLPDRPGEPKDALTQDKPHNAFGTRLKELRTQLRKEGKNFDISTRLELAVEEDSDGDGVPNQVEILTGHLPGDPNDKPTADELAKLKEAHAGFARFKSGYAWRPFEPVKRPTPPAPPVKGGEKLAWVRNPVDHFIAAEHEARGLKPRPEAPKHVLLRRVHLDLIGLPPTREELHAFLADTSPDAYEKVVDRLLASPRYGERWGRHWMDVWRYSDWAGYAMEVRNSHRHIWRWRDWIVESLNADKPYDRMVQEMLAGDELAPGDADTLRATGYLVRSWYKFNRNVWLEDTVEHTSKAFLGVTMNCARCHDHFFDPISQQEFYEFRAIFEPYQVRIDRVPGQPDINKDGLPRVYDANLETPTYLFTRGNEDHPVKDKPLGPGVPSLLGGTFKTEPVGLPPLAITPERRDFVTAEARSTAEAAMKAASAALPKADAGLLGAMLLSPCDPATVTLERALFLRRAAETRLLAVLEADLARFRRDALEAVLKLEALEDNGQRDTEMWTITAKQALAAQRNQADLEAGKNLLLAQQAVVLANDQTRPEALKKVDAAKKAQEKARADLTAPLTTAYTPRALPKFPATSSGRRLALAKWITDKQNPLAARVAVNHMWLRHFGQALVPSTFDFGRNGQRPSHPALLDWLAAEFMDQNWSMRKLHRLMVTSATYRMDSTGDAASAAVDPDNRYLWRYNSRRLEAEAVRDSVLYVAGQLDLTMGGPDIDQTQGLAVKRRSIYFRHAHEKKVEFLNIFDGPNVIECYYRTESIVPQQALALANSTLSLAQARLLARKLDENKPDAATFIATAYEQLLGRFPTTDERRECEQFLAAQSALLADKTKLTAFPPGPASPVPPSPDPRLRAREDLVHVLLNLSEFVTIR